MRSLSSPLTIGQPRTPDCVDPIATPGLSNRDRFVLAVGIHLASAALAVAGWSDHKSERLERRAPCPPIRT